MCLHVPNREEQMLIYYEFFNVVRDYSSIGNLHLNPKLSSVDL